MVRDNVHTALVQLDTQLWHRLTDLGVVSHGAVEEEDREVNGVKVGDDVPKAGAETPGQTHEPVPGVVDLYM